MLTSFFRNGWTNDCQDSTSINNLGEKLNSKFMAWIQVVSATLKVEEGGKLV
jgi:hypothetical protein